MSARLLMVERVPDELAVEPGDDVFAFSAAAAHALERRGIRFRIPADVGAEDAIARLAPDHWEEQLRWLDSLSEHVAAARGQTWAGFPALVAFELKRLLDIVLIRGLEIGAVMAASPSASAIHAW